jgi:hypothetical protein
VAQADSLLLSPLLKRTRSYHLADAQQRRSPPWVITLRRRWLGLLPVHADEATGADFSGTCSPAPRVSMRPGPANSLYSYDASWAGGRVFAYGRAEVRSFLIENAKMLLGEYHVDGLRFDEVTVINRHGGWSFYQDLARTLHY